MSREEEILQAVRLGLELSKREDMSAIQPWQEGENVAVERTAGSSKLRTLIHDDLVLAEIPKEILQLFKDAENKNAGTVQCLEVGSGVMRVVMFYQFAKTASPLGRLIMVEVTYSPGEIRYAPESQAAAIYKDGMAMIAGYMSDLDRDAWIKFIKENSER